MKILKYFMKWIYKRLAIMLICGILIILSYILLFYHYLNFDFYHQDIIYRLESKLLDIRFWIRGPVRPSINIGILSIDEKTLARFGDYPFSRIYYERVLDNLKKLGVSFIGFDAVFVEKEKAKLIEIKQDIDKLRVVYKKPKEFLQVLDNLNNYTIYSPGDLGLSRGIKNFNNIVLGYFYFHNLNEAKENLGDAHNYFENLEQMVSSEIYPDIPEGKTLEDYPFLVKAYGIKTNNVLINQQSSYFGFFSNDADNDAIVRWVNLVANVNGHLMPSLSLKLAAEASSRDIITFFNNFGVETIALVSKDDSSDVIEIPIDYRGGGRILLNHLGPSKSFPHYSIADAYDNNFSEEQKQKLNGAILLLGATATGINDIRPNVFDSTLDGVENHAAVIDNILSKKFMKRPIAIFKLEMMLVLIVGIVFMVIMLFANALSSGILVLLFLAGYWYFDYHVWFLNGTWAFIAIPSLEIVFMFLGTTLYKYMTEEKEKRKVHSIFQHYLSPEVINKVLDDPSGLKLGGERRELTVFFSDVRGFTTISESLTPERLCEFMNEYFMPMTSIILGTSGVLDKYIGDAIMAFWGAPVTLTDHADRAAIASIKMLFELDKIRNEFPKKGFPQPDIGIGLNTGEMSVGNMGSHVRFNYTVMGDAVNLASRLEGLTKEYGVKILISEFTYSKLTPSKFLTRELDDIRVKGKNKPVKIYELMRPDILDSESLIKEFIDVFNQGRVWYRQQRWSDAKNSFMQSLKIKSDDKASKLYLDRITRYQQDPPSHDWDGVYTFTHK